MYSTLNTFQSLSLQVVYHTNSLVATLHKILFL